MMLTAEIRVYKIHILLNLTHDERKLINMLNTSLTYHKIKTSDINERRENVVCIYSFPKQGGFNSLMHLQL